MLDNESTYSVFPESDERTSIEYTEVVLARLGEITLKGQNRRRFEQRLIKNMAHRLRRIGSFEVNQRHSRIWIVPQNEESLAAIDGALDIATDVFGIVSASKVRRFESDPDALRRQSIAYVAEEIKPKKGMTFKVETKRGNKQYPLNSMEISAEIGGDILAAFPELTVDVHDPDLLFILKCAMKCMSIVNCAWCSWLADRYVGTWYAVNFRWNR